MIPKVDFCTTVYEGYHHVLREAIEAIYKHAHRIIIIYGGDQWHHNEMAGQTTLLDMLPILPDPDSKIIVSYAIEPYKGKDEQTVAINDHLSPDATHAWYFAADEVYDTKQVGEVIDSLNLYTDHIDAFTFSWFCYFGDLTHYVGGWELQQQVRLFRIAEGQRFTSHRPLRTKDKMRMKRMAHCPIHHYTYLFPEQVEMKMRYHQTLNRNSDIEEGWFENVFTPWVKGNQFTRMAIESQRNGVHPFKMRMRQATPTVECNLRNHPVVIDTQELSKRIKQEWTQLRIKQS